MYNEKKHRGSWGLVGLILMILMMTGAVLVLNNREWIYDFYRGQSYSPSSEMARIRNDLQLTGEGEFIFNAAQPVLGERDEFNDACRAVIDSEVAVLGCYSGGNIYVYNVTEKELNGIRELTTAHELLHAVYARKTDEEKAALRSILETVYNQNEAILKEELGTYDASERAEELYVRAGTEVANLPEELEREYEKVFKNQDGVVNYYNSYIAVFREIRAEMDAIKSEMTVLSDRIDTLTSTYEAEMAQLEADIVSFNNCAEIAGCFASEAEFNVQRNALVARQNALEGTYDEINGLISQYNELVEQYNNDVTRGEELNQKINSNSRPEEMME